VRWIKIDPGRNAVPTPYDPHMGVPAAKEGDKVVGVDTHVIMIPSPGGPVPTPIPMPIPGSAEAPGALCVTRTGRWLGPYSPYNTFDPAVKVDRGQVVVVYRDRDQTSWQWRPLNPFAGRAFSLPPPTRAVLPLPLFFRAPAGEKGVVANPGAPRHGRDGPPPRGGALRGGPPPRPRKN